MINKRFEGTIQGMGSAKVSAPPDEAVVVLEVMTQADTAAEAVATNAELTQAVLEAVMSEPNQGVTTTGLGVHPIYEYDPETNVSSIVGFRATNGVKVVTKPISAGRVFDAGVQAGANVSSGISYRIKNEAPLREEALRLAVKQAHGEAKVVADAVDVTLLGPEEIVIDPFAGPIMMRAGMLEADAMAATPVIPEDLDIEAFVRITFKTRVG